MLCRMREGGEHLAHPRCALGAGGPRFESGRPDFARLDMVMSYRVGLSCVIEGGVKSGVKTHPQLLTQLPAHEPFASR